MKKFILAAVAMSMVATPVLAAAPQQHGRQQSHQVVNKKKVVVTKQTYRGNWRKGERFDSRQARNYRQIDYRKYRGLKAPPRGYRYVQSGNDAVLVGITSGIVAAVIANAIR